MQGPCGDIWQQAVERLQYRTMPIHVDWMHSHAPAIWLWSGMISAEWYRGNAMADVFADKGAAMAEVPPHELNAYNIKRDRMTKVHRRIVCVLKRIVEVSGEHPICDREERVVVKKPEPPVSLLSQIKRLGDLGHCINYFKSRGGTLLRCSQCMRHFPFSSIERIILRGKCVPVHNEPSEGKRPTPEPLHSEAKRSHLLPPSSAAHSTGSVAPVLRNSQESHLLLEPPWIGNKQLDRSHS